MAQVCCRRNSVIPQRIDVEIGSRLGDFDLLPKPGVCGKSPSGLRIANGEKSRIHEYPWMAILEFEYRNNKI